MVAGGQRVNTRILHVDPDMMIRGGCVPLEKPSNLLIVFAGCGDLIVPTESNGFVPAEVSRLVVETYPDVSLRIDDEPSQGLGQLRANLESGDAQMVSHKPDIVVLSLAGDVGRFTGENAEEVLVSIHDELLSTIDLIKSAIGAHVLVANLSTLDPGHLEFNYHGLTEEPFSMRAHRLNRMLAAVSHERGISVIDVDRVIAEVGGKETVVGPAQYREPGLRHIAKEIFRVVEDYGFFDERPILEQIGADAGP